MLPKSFNTTTTGMLQVSIIGVEKKKKGELGISFHE
jgi:hypothetical protein